MVKLSRRQVLAGAALGGAALLGPFVRTLGTKDASAPVVSGVFRVDDHSSSTGRLGDWMFLSAQPGFSWPSGSTITFGKVLIPAAQCTRLGSSLLFHVPAHLAGAVPVTGTAGDATSHAATFTYLTSDVPASSGLYRGSGNLRVTEPALNHPVHFGLGYLGNGSAAEWTAVEPSWSAIADEYRYWQAGGTMVWQTAMLPERSPGVSLQAGEGGVYDSYWAKLARRVMTSIPGTSYFSLGWEYSNTEWFPWGVTSLADALSYAAYYRRIVDIMRSTLAAGDLNLKSNVSFRFGWNFNRGPSRVPKLIETSYPGDDHVDVVGFDFYDQGPQFTRKTDGTWADPARVWNQYLTEPYSLQWISQFAIEHGKSLGFPEWGLVGLQPPSAQGGGDDPYFITAFSKWLADQPRIAYNCYFEFDPLTTDGTYHSLQNFPQSALAFRASF